MHDSSDAEETSLDSDWGDNYFSSVTVQSVQKQVYRWLIASLFTAIIAATPAVAQSSTIGEQTAEDALTSVIDTVLGLIIDVGALILIAYAAVNFIRIGVNGVRGGPVKRFAITLGMAILLLMFQDVIEPFIRGLAETGNSATIILPKTAPVVAALPV